MKVSVIIPVYNSAEFLESCVDSVLTQSYDDLEVLLVNNASTDKSGLICDDLAARDLRVRTIHLKRKGVSLARNCGIDSASGDLITFLDSDDKLLNDAIKNTVALIESKKVEMVRTNYIIQSSTFSNAANLTIEPGIYTSEDEKKIIVNSIALGVTPGYVWLLMARRELLQSVRFEEDLSMMEDAVFSIELLNRAESICVSDETTHIYNQVLNSASNSLHRIDKITSDIIKATYLIENIIEKSIIKQVKASRSSAIANYAVDAFKSRNFADFKRIYNNLRLNTEYREFIGQSDLSYLSWRFSGAVQAIYRGNYAMLVVVSLLRMLMSGVKGAVK